jgi:hypothetical protein
MPSIALARMVSLQSPANIRAATRKEQVILNITSASRKLSYGTPRLTFKRSPLVVSGLGIAPNWKIVVPLNTMIPCCLFVLINRCPRSPSCPVLHPNRDVYGDPAFCLSVSIALTTAFSKKTLTQFKPSISYHLCGLGLG